MRILLIDDDCALTDAVCAALGAQGFAVDVCADGADAPFYLSQKIYDAVIVDRMLPGCDGLTLVARLRAEGDHVPVLMLTALGRVGDRVDGLDAGADDYLTKPFDMRELAARLRALLRRPSERAEEGVLRAGALTLDASQMTLTGPAGTSALSRRECDLLSVFLRSPGRLLARSVLLGSVWGAEADVEDASLDSYVYFARRRLAAAGAGRIVTVRGVGYRFEVTP